MLTAGLPLRHQAVEHLRAAVWHLLLTGACWLLLAYALSVHAGEAATVHVIQDVRLRSDHRETRVVIEVDSVAPYEIGRLAQPHRLFIDLPQARLAHDWERHSIQVDDGRVGTVRIAQNQADQVRVVLDLQADGDYFIFTLLNPYRIVVDVRGGKVAAGPRRTPPTAQTRAQRLTIVLDPGHGGKDPGAIGPGGLMEKKVVLQVAKELRQIVQQAMPGSRVILTRDTDVFVPLKRRAEMANQLGAQLFISLHANASPNQEASGIETWYLSFAASARAKHTAARENQMHEAQLPTLEIILRDLQQTDRINESAILAGMTQTSLAQYMAGQFDDIVDRGVDGAPFVVLLHTSMPSILVEISFMSNPRDEKRLTSRGYQRALAQGIFRGLHKYLQSAVVAAQ